MSKPFEEKREKNFSVKEYNNWLDRSIRRLRSVRSLGSLELPSLQKNVLVTSG